jgi:serine/threonine protein kinase
MLHEVGFLHSDVKPNNVVLDAYSDWGDLFHALPTPGTNGSGMTVTINDQANVSLVDFGLSERYIIQNPHTGEWQHIPCEKINRTLGNKFFMSLNQLKKYGMLQNFVLKYPFSVEPQR